MIARWPHLVLLAAAFAVACQSGPEQAPDDEPRYPAAQQQDPYPDTGPPLRTCPDHDSNAGEICRLTPVGDDEARIIVSFPDETTVESAEAMPSDLIRFQFLGRQEGFAACLIPAARQGWAGEIDTAIKATIVGSAFEHVTMAPMGLPEDVTACFVELTRRLRVTRPPGPEARVIQPVRLIVKPREQS